MSASTEIFESLNASALAWTKSHLASSNGASVDRTSLSAFLGEQAALLRPEVAGSEDLTDGTVRGAVDSLTRFYGRWVSRVGLDNTALFHAVAVPARAWTQARLARRPAGAVLRGQARVDLWDFIRATAAQACQDLGLDPVAARAERVIVRVNRFCLAMPRASRAGASVTPRPASRVDKQADLNETVEAALLGVLEGQAAPAKTIDEVMGMMRGRKVSAAGVLVPAFSRTAVARAVARFKGKPRREATVGALRPIVRDLVWVIDNDLPASTVTLVTLDALAARLWSPQASTAGRCVHRRRVIDALAEITPALGIHVRLSDHGKSVLIGRGRRIPTDQKLVASAFARRPRAFPVGLMPARMGVWGTKTGTIVQAALRVVASPAHEDDVDLVARAVGHPNGCPGMRELAAGGPSDGFWYPTAAERPAKRRADAKWRHDVHEWASYVYTGNRWVTADNWGVEDRNAALSILDLIGAGADNGIPGVLDHLVERIHDLRFCRDGVPILAQDDGEGWNDMQDVARLLDGADFETWEGIVMGTASAGRPGRRPARTPALASKPILPMPAEPEPGPSAARPSGVTVYGEDKPRPKRLPVPVDVLQMMDCSVTRRLLAAEWHEIKTSFSDAPSGLLADPEAGRDALRESLTIWATRYPTLAKLDTLMKGSVRYAMTVAGLLLKANGNAARMHTSRIIAIDVHCALMDSSNGARRLSELAWRTHAEANAAFPESPVGVLLIA